MKKILMIIGSQRRNSFNRRLAEETARIIGDRAEISFLDYSNLPFMNQDIEFPAPAPVERVRNEARNADAIWIFTPEYNYSIPGGLKNLLDWLSRPLKAGDYASGTAVSGKPVTVSGAGGRNATASVRQALDALLPFMKMNMMKENEAGIALPGGSFASDELIVTDEIREKLKTQADSFLSFIS